MPVIDAPAVLDEWCRDVVPNDSVSRLVFRGQGANGFADEVLLRWAQGRGQKEESRCRILLPATVFVTFDTKIFVNARLRAILLGGWSPATTAMAKVSVFTYSNSMASFYRKKLGWRGIPCGEEE
jgi:hypothetical protein